MFLPYRGGVRLSETQALYEAVARESAVRFPSRKIVSGVGPQHPAVMLIGEAPGAKEVEEGRPFAGAAGKNLDEFLAATGLTRETLYISNVVKIRPCEQGPTGRLRNRPPNTEEIAFFLPWLEKEILLLKPRLLVTLGNTPLKALYRADSTVGACHGQLLESRPGLPLFSLYHPASVIYNRSLAAVYRADMERLAQIIQSM